MEIAKIKQDAAAEQPKQPLTAENPAYKCLFPNCNLEFLTPLEKLHHMKASRHSSRKQQRDFFCYCGTAFGTQRDQLEHIRLSHNATFKCNACGRVMLSEKTCRRHILKAHGSGFFTVWLLSRGSSEKDGGEIFRCPICEVDCEGFGSYKEHADGIDHFDNATFLCEGSEGNEGGGVKETAAEVGGKGRKNAKAPNESAAKTEKVVAHCESAFFHCSDCKRSFRRSSDLTRHRDSAKHRQRHLGDTKATQKLAPRHQQYTCFVCSLAFKSDETFKRHCSRFHVDGAAAEFTARRRSPPDLDLMHCDLCAFKVRSRKLMHKHMRRHVGTSARRFVCEACGRSFGTRSHLRRHAAFSHEGEKREKTHCCDKCGKRYTSRKSLKEHRMYAHEKAARVLRLACETCGLRFEKMCKYRTHAATARHVERAKTMGRPVFDPKSIDVR